MKTKEELNALKEEVEALNKKFAELTEEELAQVSGGYDDAVDIIELIIDGHKHEEYDAVCHSRITPKK